MRKFQRNLLIGFAVFAAGWAAIVFAEFRLVDDLDTRVSLALNGLAARSEVLALTCVFLAREPGTYALGLACVLAVVLLSRRAGRTAPSSIVLYLAWLALVALASALLVEAVDHYIKRVPPAEAIPGFSPLPTASGLLIEIPDRIKYPDLRLSVSSSLVFILFFRFGSRALLLGLGLVLVGVADIAVGTAWTTDVLSALLFGWLFAAAAYTARANELAGWMEKKGSGAGARLATRIGARFSRARVPFDFRREEADDEGGARALGMAKALDPEERALLEEGWGLEQPRPLAAAHKEKLLPIKAGGARYAFKRTRRYEGGEAPLLKALRTAEDLRSRGILDAPRIVPDREGALLRFLRGRAVYVMEWAEGSPVDASSRAEMSALFRALARLHRHTAPAGPEVPAAEALEAELEKAAGLVEAASARPASLLGGLVPDNAEHARSNPLLQLALQSEAFLRVAAACALQDGAVHAPSMLHRDTHPMNFLWKGGGEVAVLDIDRMAPGIGVADLVWPLGRHARRSLWDPAGLEALLGAYQEVRPIPRWEMAMLLALVVLPESAQRLREEPAGRRRGRRAAAALADTIREGISEPRRRDFLLRCCRGAGLDTLLLFMGEVPERKRPQAAQPESHGAVD